MTHLFLHATYEDTFMSSYDTGLFVNMTQVSFT